MTHRHLVYLVALTLAIATVLVTTWEFYLEHIIVPYLFGEEGEAFEETSADHLRYIITVLAFTAISLIVPTLFAFNAMSQNRRMTDELRRAYVRLEENNADLEARVAARTKELVDAKNQAMEATRAKSIFLATMSHEIRTPLTAIIGFSECLLDAEQNMSDRIDAIQTINRCGTHLLGVITDILDLSKIEANKIEIEVAEVTLSAFVQEISAYSSLLAESKGLSFDVEYEFPLPVRFKTDPTRLKQILINFLSNAFKFTKRGGVRLIIRFDRNAQHLVFDVVDSGKGMSEQELSMLFLPFSQTDASIAREYGGSGLGLSIAKKLAERMGGSLTASSAPGIGSRFSVLMPCGTVEDSLIVNQLPSISRTVEYKANRASRKLRGSVLLVEDNEDNQKLISLFLRRLGLKVSIASNGKLGVQRVSEQRYDLILMDMQMPVMDGLEATQELRRSGCGITIIALTADANETMVYNCLAAGCDDHLVKPINHERFYLTLAKHLPFDEKREAAGDPLFSNDDPEALELMQKFASEFPSTVESFSVAYEKKDWSFIKKHAHDLKGLGGSFGLGEVSDVAKRIESAVIREQMSELALLLTELRELKSTVNNKVKKAIQ